MIEDSLSLAQCRLQKDILFEAGMYNDSLGKSYYAMFNAARALLALKKLDSKKNSGVISLFNRHFHLVIASIVNSQWYL